MAENTFLYRSITNDLRAAISAGKYSPDEMIPSENKLASEYGTSRITVRKALRILESEGLIKPRQGKGYFVLSPEYSRFTLDFSEKPADSTTIYLEINVAPADEDIASELNSRQGRMLVVIRRLILRDSDPVSFDEKFIPYVKGDPIIERELHYSQFPDVFTDKYVPRRIWTEMEIEAKQGPDAVCAALGSERGSVLLCVSRRVRTLDDEVIGFGRRWYRASDGKLSAASEYYMENG